MAMPLIRFIIACQATLVTVALCDLLYGPGSISAQPLGDDNLIREVTTTLVLPEFQTGPGRVIMYLGMITTTEDYVQSCASSDRTSEVAPEYANKWNCDTFVNAGPGRGPNVEHPGAPAVPGDRMTSRYVYSDSTGEYTQTNSVNGRVVSTYTRASGHGISLQFNAECLTFVGGKPVCGTIFARKFIDTTVVLDKPDSSFGDFDHDPGVTGGKWVSTQGGKVWTMSELDIAKSSTWTE
ncbi:hypothetical protein EJ03DRAFT_319442 [Teratosphaeria nubilosa]|uniref:Secreted protein n=1 Tax=Teratosphaeria nubilosa TaxID=161662 RepID=A0A6G1KZK8_9PEZI|nr:hypothetical protein EJ03DRAFT_319442 [Teratosphaeria nubilosa]